MQAKKWTASGIAVELKRERRSISKLLEGVEPVEVVQQKKRQIKYYLMRDVVDTLIGQMERLDYTQEKARLTREQADKIERENAQRRGDLIDLDTVVRAVTDTIVAVKTRLLALPSEQAAYLANQSARKVRTKLDDAIRRCLQEFSRTPYVDVQRAGQADGKRVGGRKPATQPGGKRAARKVAH